MVRELLKTDTTVFTNMPSICSVRVQIRIKSPKFGQPCNSISAYDSMDKWRCLVISSNLRGSHNCLNRAQYKNSALRAWIQVPTISYAYSAGNSSQILGMLVFNYIYWGLAKGSKHMKTYKIGQKRSKTVENERWCLELQVGWLSDQWSISCKLSYLP